MTIVEIFKGMSDEEIVEDWRETIEEVADEAPNDFFEALFLALGIDGEALAESDEGNGMYAGTNYHDFVVSIIRTTLKAAAQIEEAAGAEDDGD